MNIARKSPVASRPDVRGPMSPTSIASGARSEALAAMEGMSGLSKVPQAKKPMACAAMTRKAAYDGERHALE